MKDFIIIFLILLLDFIKIILNLKDIKMDSQTLQSLLPLVVLFAIFYFLIIRPQQKQAKKHKQMVQDLKKGDKILTNGGLIVEISKIETEYMIVKNYDDTQMKLSKEFISKILV